MKASWLGLGFLVLSIFGCSGGTDFSGSWKVDLKNIEQSEKFKKQDEMVVQTLLEIYKSMSIEISGNTLIMSGLGKATKCTINNFDADNGVTCEDGETTFGLYKKGDILIMKDGSSDEKSVQLIRSATSPKTAVSSPSVSTDSKSDPRVFVVGKWAGEPGWECSDPIVITSDSVSLGKGQKIPLVIDGDGSVVLEEDGPFLTPNFESNTLVYGGSESGDSFALKKCQ